MLVTIDTQIMIWGVRGAASKGQEGRIPHAQAFLKFLDEHQDHLALTAHVASEYLVGDHGESQSKELDEISQKFIVLPFDTNAAAIAAELRRDKDFVESLKDDFGKTRVCMKADIMIVATAKANGVQKLYSEDSGLCSVAKRASLSASPMPAIDALKKDKQVGLFDEEE